MTGARFILVATLWMLGAIATPGICRAQAGPPFLSNDPGTPGDTNWEINIAAMPTLARGSASYQLPQIDLNYGLGERIQLTFEVPYELEINSGQPMHSGWSNAITGAKWRFLDQGEEGWQVSTFPQIESGASTWKQLNGIAGPGPRVLLPIEAARKLGPINIDLEVGEYVPLHGPHERIIGIVAGRSVTARLELDGEIYDDRATDALPHGTTFDLGGRYTLHPGIIALFMIGRSISGTGNGQPEFLGYFGVQILLSDYGRRLSAEP
jgi:hypothetical protein